MPMWLKIVMALGTVLAVPFLYAVLTYARYTYDGPSMEPTLYNGDKFIIHRTQEVQLGDIVVLVSPFDAMEIVKRVVAVGGDRVSEVQGELIVNGQSTRGPVSPCPSQPLLEANGDEVCHDSQAGAVRYQTVDSNNFFRDVEETIVPEGHVWVRGDHRDRSNDSCNPRIGAVPLELVRGVVMTDWL